MARIRTIKPEFFRHEGLQELEINYPDMYPMLVFSALWGHCDKNGVFEWKPRMMQLDIIPFIWEATGKQLRSTLELLVKHQFIITMTDGMKVYGYVPTFTEHQRINGKEAQAPSSYPQVDEMQEYSIDEATGKHPRSTREAPEITGREGKGREEEGNLSSSSSPDKEIETTLPIDEQKPMKMMINDFRIKYQETFNKLMPGALNNDADQLCREYPRETLESAFQVTAQKGGASFAYLKAVLTNTPKGINWDEVFGEQP